MQGRISRSGILAMVLVTVSLLVTPVIVQTWAEPPASTRHSLEEEDASHNEESDVDRVPTHEEIGRLIRGCDPNPGAWALRGDEKVRLYDGRFEPEQGGEPGQVIGTDDGRLLLAARGGRAAFQTMFR